MGDVLDVGGDEWYKGCKEIINEGGKFVGG